MRRTQSKQILNRYAAWKYIVIAVTVMVMFFSALPSIFGEDAAVQIGNKAGLGLNSMALNERLLEAGFDVKRIDEREGQIFVVLSSQSQQAEVKQFLGSYVLDSEELTLALAPAAPNWLLSLGVNPIKLGLDLRGGVQFLLDVDLDPVYRLHAESLVDSIRQFSRENKIMGTKVHVSAGESVTMTQANPDNLGKLKEFISAQYPAWKIDSLGGSAFALALKDEEIILLRDLTVKQNLQIMRSRIAQLGITEALVQRQGEHRIRIELPGVQDPGAAKSVIGATASLAFYEVMGPGAVNAKILRDTSDTPVYVARRAVLGGEHIVDARAGLGEMGGAEVNITLDSTGASMMSDFSRDHIGEPMATSYSEYSRDENGKVRQTTEVISVATIQAQLGKLIGFWKTGTGAYSYEQTL